MSSQVVPIQWTSTFAQHTRLRPSVPHSVRNGPDFPCCLLFGFYCRR
ncbi:hypothetical protein RB213_014564 [Colletotrichum asianum]